MDFTAKQIDQFVKKFDASLLTSSRHAYHRDTLWLGVIDKAPGIYAIFIKDTLVYIGETADLRARMGDIRRTYNHTFRRKLGQKEFNGVLEGNKFSELIEDELHNFCEKHVEIVFQVLHFGRLEVESRLIAKYGNQLLNSPRKRGKKKK